MEADKRKLSEREDEGMLFILNLAIGAGSGLALSIPFLGWLEGTVHKGCATQRKRVWHSAVRLRGKKV